MIWLILVLLDLAVGEFWDAPPEISFGRVMPLDCLIGRDPVMCIIISVRAASGGHGAKLR